MSLSDTPNTDPPTDASRLGRPLDLASFPKRKRRHRPRKGKKFLWGPVPWEWLTAAAAISCSAVLVGLVLWHLAGLRKSHTVRFEYGRAADFGLHRQTVYDALKRLSEAGLVQVDRGNGRCPVVTILDAPGGETGND
jgi:hypothetical protein